MNGIARATDGLDLTVTFLKRTTEALWHAVILVGLVCLIAVILAGTFGILHKGDDIGWDLNLGDGRGGGGDVIVVPGALS